MTTTDLRSIVSSGGGLILDAANFTVTDLRSIASAANGKGYITLKNVTKFAVTDLRSIASAGGGHVILDLL